MRVSFLLLACWMIAPLAVAEPVRTIGIVNDRAPDCSSLQSIVESVTRGCKTDDERAIAIYNFCRYDHYHLAYPSEPGGVSALKFINVYGWGLCGGQHTVMAAIWEEAGFDWRYRGWSSPGHTTVEAFYGGRWHYLDTFLKFYAWMPDPAAPGGRTIASQEDIKANPSLVTDGFVMDQARKVAYHANNRFDYTPDGVHWRAPAFMVCGDTLSGVLSGVRSSRNSGSPRGWGGIRFDGDDYSTSVDLSPGYSLTLNWARSNDAFYFRGRNEGARHSCGDKDYRNCPAIGPLLEPYRNQDAARGWSNGTLVFKPDLGNEAFLSGLEQAENVTCRDGALHPSDTSKPGVLVIGMASPYVIAKASCRIDSSDLQIDLSTDRKTWIPIEAPDFSSHVAGKYAYFVRVAFEKPITQLELTSIVQHNQEALPYLAPGNNRITVTAANPQALGKNRLAVTYAYCLGSRDKTPEELLGRDAEIARAHYASWSETPIVVRKIIDQFPATIDIPIPTPNGKQPVYPRMLFLRREVLAPGQLPGDVPVQPSEPTIGPNHFLAEVPVPWLIGTQPPPKTPDLPTRTETRSATRVHYVSKQGETFAHWYIKWLKDNSDAWILLIDFDVADLPDVKSLASAKLVFHVHEAHDKAPMQVAAVALTEPFEMGKSYDFLKLARTLGSTIIAKGNGPGDPLDPPRQVELDLTQAVRRWTRGEPFHGIALRIVPNRSVDDGWTVRFTPSEDKLPELNVSTYVE